MQPLLKLAAIATGLSLAVGLAFSGAAWSGSGPKGHAHGPAASGAAAAETAYGMPGDKGKSARIVEVVMKEGDGSMSFVPALVAVRRGEQIRFKLKNVGALDHEIVIATLAENLLHAKAMENNPGMMHVEPNAKRLKPNASGEILWRFTKAGEFDMSCLIPGHREAGMTGKIIVK